MSISRSLLAFPLFIFTFLSHAQEGHWVEVTAQYTGTDVTPDEGKRRALEIARGEAIKKAVGVRTTQETYWNQSEASKGGVWEDSVDVFSVLTRSTASGRIIEEEKEEKTIVDENNQPVYLVRLKARVAADVGEPDPAFQLTLSIDRDVYYDRSPGQSDEIKIHISSTKNCFLYLFNILSNDSVDLLMPSEYLPVNAYEIDAKAQAFDEAIAAKSIHFRVGVPTGKLRSKEALCLIGTKERIDFRSDHFAKDGRNVIATRAVALTDIMNWLVRIPPEMRTEVFRSYEIRKWGAD